MGEIETLGLGNFDLQPFPTPVSAPDTNIPSQIQTRLEQRGVDIRKVESLIRDLATEHRKNEYKQLFDRISSVRGVVSDRFSRESNAALIVKTALEEGWPVQDRTATTYQLNKWVKENIK
jgi:hypothetical protein